MGTKPWLVNHDQLKRMEMKQKLNIGFFIGLFIISVLVCSCKKQEEPVKPQPSTFSVAIEGGNTSFSAAGGTANIVVTAGENGWWVVMPTNNWCVITKLYGSGDLKVPVTIKPNTTGSDRNIQVEVRPTFNLLPVMVTLTQSK
jgi:hypothetical protein